LSITLILLILASILVIEWVDEPDHTPNFFFGVEFAWGDDVEGLRDLVDEVKNYTNLFVIGSPQISLNQTKLNETCDYIYNAGLHFIILFDSPAKYTSFRATQYQPYHPYVWIAKAKQKYGDKFIAAYYFDEPGGNQLDNGASRQVLTAEDYTDASKSYIDSLTTHIEYFLYSAVDVITADYGLYWFDYKGGYDTVLAEFGSNHSRQMHVGLCRGAAKVQKRDWGVIVTWTYDNPPYIESGQELYDDLVLAYHSGAKYVVVFDYPKIGQYGILTDEHLDAMKEFWEYIHSNPTDFGINYGEVAYVLPQDYGFGFRSSRDRIWGLWDADDLSQKVWNDLDKLILQYGSRLDIVYAEPKFDSDIRNRYENLFFWNETIS
jgi:hypothetical protein